MCDEPFGPSEGGLLAFKLRPSDEAWERHAREQPGFCGHPPHEDWFCGEHRAAAEALAHLAIDEARRRLAGGAV